MLILCPNCSTALPEWLLHNRLTRTGCPSCYSDLTIEVFPALFRRPESILARAPAVEGEACCYEHAKKPAVSLCNQCGRFLCGLCEIELEEKIWCPGCLALDQPAPRLATLEKRRTLYDSIALALAIWPALLFFYPSVITAPIVFYLTIRRWKSPSSLIPRNKWRFVVASILALAELGFLLFLIIFMLITLRNRPR